MALRIKEKYIKKLKRQTLIIDRLLKENGLINVESIRRWYRNNDPNGPLTSLPNIKILAHGLNIDEDELTEQAKNGTHKIRKRSPGPVVSG